MSKSLFFHPLNRNDDLKESESGVGVGILGVGVGPYTFRLRNPGYEETNLLIRDMDSAAMYLFSLSLSSTKSNQSQTLSKEEGKPNHARYFLLQVKLLKQ